MKSIYKKISIPIIAFFLSVLIPVSVSAQFNQAKKADQLYENFEYSHAAEIYETLYQRDASNSKYIQRLAYCYYKMLDYNKALHYYSILVQSDNHQAEDLYTYAQLLLIDGKYDESKSWLSKYIISSPGDQRAKKQFENFDLLLKIKSDNENITVRNLAQNTRVTDMCPTFYKDKIVYSSAKDSFSVVSAKFKWNNQPFLDIYESESGPTPNLKNDKPFSSALNSKYHEGPVCFTSDFKTIYFTRNSFLNGKVTRTSDGINNLKIYISDFDGKEWKNIRGLPFNSDTYSVGHPALSPDNKTLYFVSDMPGGFGETDIYKSEWTNGAWGKPMNLGESINTPGKEMFPYVDADGILYFSSDGFPGSGGLDIFAAKKGEDGTYLVVNMGSPLNSSYDDFGYVVNKDSLFGYFTSNRPGGKGEDDNYYFTVNKIGLRVVCYDDRTKAIIPGSKIALLGSDGKVIESKIADKDGSVEFAVNPREKYQLLAENQTYIPLKKDIQVHGLTFDFKQNENIFLKKGVSYLTIQVVDKESGLIIPKALVNISEGKYDESGMEDNNGIIKMKLNASTDYTFNVSAEKYFDKTVKFTSIGKDIGEYSMTVELEKLSIGKQFVLDDLYYDLNKYNIRPDAAIVLDKLAKILTDNPEVRIEIGSHTDSRGTSESNMALSQHRSESVMAYLIGKGIAKNRLVAKGYGETQLVNKCADGVDCPEVDHQANRRTVIEILNSEIRKVNRGAKDVYYF